MPSDAKLSLEANKERQDGQLQAARAAMLSELVLLISKTADLDQLLKQFVGKVKWVLDFDRCTLALLDAGGDTYQLQTLLESRRGVPEFAQTAIPLSRGLPGDVMQSGEMRLIDDVAALRSA